MPLTPRLTPRSAAVALLGLALVALPAAAQHPDTLYHPVLGPASVLIGGDLATLDLPGGFAFLNGEDTHRILRKSGNVPSGDELGLIQATAESLGFAVLIGYQPLGYISDEDAGKLDADKIFKSIHDGTEEANKERAKMHAPALHVVSWVEKPHYLATRHEVAWAILGRDDAGGGAVNYFTRVLGRKGVLVLDLVTDPSTLERDKPQLKGLIDRIAYKPGLRYADFDPKHDKKSGLNLTTLIVAGGAAAVAAKTGLLGMAGKFLLGILLAAKKLIALAIAAVAGLIAKLRGRKKDAQPGETQAPPEPPVT